MSDNWQFGPNDCIAILRSKDPDDTFTDYETYTIKSDLLDPSDSFEFRKPAPSAEGGLRDTISHRSLTMAMPIYLQIETQKGQALQLRGRIYRSAIDSSKDHGTEYHIVGYDHMRPLVDSDVMPGLVFNNVTFRDVILKVLAPFGFTENDILIDNAANRNFLLGRGSTTTTVRDPSQALAQALIDGDASVTAPIAAIPIVGPDLLKNAQAKARLRMLGADIPTPLAFPGYQVTPFAAGVLQSTDTYDKNGNLVSRASATHFDAVSGEIKVDVESSYILDVTSGAYIPASQAGVDVPIGFTRIPAEKPRYISTTALNMLDVKKAKPHAGESVYDFLHRHAIRYNLLIWGTADGKIVFGKPNFTQDPLFSFICQQGDAAYGNNCESISRVQNIEHRPSEIHVYGHSVGGDFARSPIHSVVFDPFIQSMGLYRPITIHDNSCKTKADADQRANYELCIRRQTADVVRVTVSGHAQNGYVYAIDTTANVVWPAGEIEGPMYIISRTFTRSKESGTHTILDLVPLNSIVLGPPTDASVNEA